MTMALRLGSNLLMIALFGLAAVMLVPAALGFHRYVILTGSMTGTYDPGSIVYDRPVPTSSLRVGDVITYAPPPGTSLHDRVTHRIHRVSAAPDGRRVFQTKGDYNERPDNWRFVLPQPTQDKVAFHIPYLGYAFQLLSVPRYRKIAIGIPAVLVAMWTIAGLWKDGGEAQRRRARGVAPWAPDVGRLLPQLAPAVGTAPAASRATVRVEVSWPPPAPGRRRGAPPAPSRSLPPTAPLESSGTPPAQPRLRAPRERPRRARVTLPEACVTRTRGSHAAVPRRLPADWRLIVRRAAS